MQAHRVQPRTLPHAVRRLWILAVTGALVAAAIAPLVPRLPVHAQGVESGIDVSEYQGTISWSAVANAGISFAYIRAGDGTYKDPDFLRNWDGASANGVTPGAYLYFEPAVDPTVQAQALISSLESVTFGRGDMVPAIDVEVTGGQTAATIVQNLQTMVNDVQSVTGILPAIYTAPSWWDGHVGSSQFTADPLWVACWCSGSPSLPAGDWGGFGYQVWQYTSSGSVPGISGNVDLDQGNPAPAVFTSASTSSINGPPNAPAGQAVTVTAAVATSQAAGSVTFTLNGAGISGCVQRPFTGSMLSCTIASVQAGNQRIAAYYSTGAGYFSSAASYVIGVTNIAWPPAQGNPALGLTPTRQLNAFWRGTDSHLEQTWSQQTGPWAGPDDWTAQLGGAALASTPTVNEDASGQTDVFWQGSNNDLWQTWYAPGGGWSGPIDWSAAWQSTGTVASRPSVTEYGSQTLVFWQGANHDLWQAWYTPGGGWTGPVDWSQRWQSAGTVASTPSVAILDIAGNPTQTLVFWQGTNQDLWQSWYTPGLGWSGPVDWTAQWHGTGPVASTPSVAINGDQTHVFWQGTNNHIWQAWYDPAFGWNGPIDWNATWRGATAGSATAASQPSLTVTTAGETHLFWQGSNGHLWQAWYTPGTGWNGPIDWTAQWGSASVMASPPTVVFLTSQVLVLWTDPSGHIWEAVYAWGWSGPDDWEAA